MATAKGSQLQGRQSLWDLLTALSASKCVDRRDRIYGLLALVQEGASFTVSYTESPSDLFWRAGEHFGAWARPAYICTLQLALTVDVVSLNADLERSTSEQFWLTNQPSVPHHQFTIELRYVHPSSLMRMLSARPLCGRKDCDKLYDPVPKNRNIITLCARLSADDHPGAECIHVLLQPNTLASKEKDPATILHSTHKNFTTTLYVPNYGHYYHGWTEEISGRGDLQLYTQFGWEVVESWDSIEERTRRGKQEGRWRVHVSRSLTAKLLEETIRTVQLLRRDNAIEESQPRV